MSEQVISIPVNTHTAERLIRLAGDRRVKIEELAAEALTLFVAFEDQSDPPSAWSQEDLEAIQRGLDQLERGEGVDQDVVEREIDELLRS